MLIQKSSLSTRTTLTCDKNGGCTRIHHVSYFRRMISNDQRDIDHRIIRSVYETFMPINDELHELIVSKTTYVEIAKGQEFIQQGGPNDQLGLLVDGLMRSVEIIDGDDHTMIFFDAPCFVTEYVGFLRREPSRHSIIALEDCRLYVWSYDDLQKMYSLSKESERVGRLIAECVIADVVNDVRSFRFDTATERYEKLTATFPKLVQRVPQYMIASYLGVTPESLSRIRAKLIKE
jgi:CRP-like cAMP-binding protein